MTDETTDTVEEQPPEQMQMPEMETYTVVATRIFEVDLADQQVQGMMQQQNTDDPEKAIEQVFAERERENVEPEQKLIGLQTQVEQDAESPDGDAE